MKKLLTLLACGMLVSSSAFAALPPLWQGAAEIKAILEDQQLSNVIPSGDVLRKIVKIQDGYLIITNKRKAFVKVHYEASAQPGPAQFKIEFGKVKLKHHLDGEHGQDQDQSQD